jgi:hypothetical protein
MHAYHERLRPPVTWWVGAMVIMFMFGAVAWTGFDLLITLAIFAALFGLATALLLNWGRAKIEVEGSILRAGGATLPLSGVGEVRALDEAQARALRGPRADPRAYTLIRPYLRYAVYVQVTAPNTEVPYWLLATRRPAELAAAIESARPVINRGGIHMG